ncbi:MAG: polymer-forming cytoskeletal protein [Candidatus Auribacterota bacterium]
MSNILKRLSSASVEKDDRSASPVSSYDASMKETVAMPTPSFSKSNSSVITSDVKFDGEIEFNESLTIYGSVKGSIKSSGTLLLEKGASVDATINAKSLTVRGNFKGKIEAEEKVELLSQAQVIGDINANRIKVEDGVKFVGKANINSKKTK